MKEIGLMHPEGDAFFALQPDTILYAVTSTADGTVRVQGFTSTGAGWSHEDQVSFDRLESWFVSPPFCEYSLVGTGATNLILVDVATRKIYVAPKDAVADWTLHILTVLRALDTTRPPYYH